MKKSLRTLLGTAAAVACLSACTPSASTAAVADGAKISEGDIDAIIEACDDLGAPLLSPQASRSDVVFSEALGQLADQGFLGDGVVPAKDEARQALAERMPGNILSDPDCGDFYLDTYRFNMGMNQLAQTLDEGQLQAKTQELVSAVELNPRYGRMRLQESGQFSLDSGSLSTPAGTN